MRKIISLTSLAALVSLAALASGQSPRHPPGARPAKQPASPGASGSSSGSSGTTTDSGTILKAKSGLEKALEEALKSNPDLRVAAAKVSEAEAVFTRARLQVTQKVVAAYQAVEIAKATATLSQAQLGRVRQLGKSNAVSQEDVSRAEQELVAAKAKQAAAEADLHYLLGKTAGNVDGSTNRFSAGGEVRMWTIPGAMGPAPFTYYGLSPASPSNFSLRSPQTTANAAKWNKSAAADQIRKVLDRRVTVKFSETPALEALKTIQKEAQGLHIKIGPPAPGSLKDDPWSEKLTATLTDVPLGAVLQMLEDSLGDFQVAVRSYGLFIARKEHIPVGAVLLDDFWQGGLKSDQPGTAPQKK